MYTKYHLYEKNQGAKDSGFYLEEILCMVQKAFEMRRSADL
jgi:hypothetical protein